VSIAAYLSRQMEVDLKKALEDAIGISRSRTAPVQTTKDDCLPREYRDMAEHDVWCGDTAGWI